MYSTLYILDQVAVVYSRELSNINPSNRQSLSEKRKQMATARGVTYRLRGKGSLYRKVLLEFKRGSLYNSWGDLWRVYQYSLWKKNPCVLTEQELRNTEAFSPTPISWSKVLSQAVISSADSGLITGMLYTHILYIYSTCFSTTEEIGSTSRGTEAI